MSVKLSRRSLFARLRGGPPQNRPPWSVAEATFTDACTQCGKCLEACPQGILSSGHAGYPIVSFEAGHCTFCGACKSSCEAGCYDDFAAEAWDLKATISQACVEPKGVTCRMCEEACDETAIRFRPMVGGRAQPLLDVDACTGCGACVARCPVAAISISSPTQPESSS